MDASPYSWRTCNLRGFNPGHQRLGNAANYQRPAKNVVQEWEMNDDLGDRHANSLQQGGKLPNNSLECRVVGRIYAKAGEEVQIEWYPSSPNLALTLAVLDKDCGPIDSATQTGNGLFTFTPTYSGWHTIRLRNATATQAGQHCWVKAIYQAPAVVATNEVKNKCACAFTEPGAALEENLGMEVVVYPNRLDVSLHPSGVANLVIEVAQKPLEAQEA